jgi:hypothetical protein
MRRRIQRRNSHCLRNASLIAQLPCMASKSDLLVLTLGNRQHPHTYSAFVTVTQALYLRNNCVQATTSRTTLSD